MNMKRFLISVAGVLVLLATAAIFIPQVNAVQRGAPGQDYYWKFYNRDENLFKAAAYIYYNKQGVLGRVDCMPQDVVIDYGTTEKNWIAWAYIYGAYKDTFPEGSKKYCRVFWNTNYWAEPRANACVTFIHEYGHLLGREHNNNLQSPMFGRYDLYPDSKFQALQDRRNKNVIAKSVCNALEIRGR